MAEQSITCPHCGKAIPLTKALTADIEETLRSQFEAKAKKREDALVDEYAEKLKEAQTKAQKEAKKRAEEGVSTEMAALREQVAERDKQIAETRKKELDLLKRQRAVEDREKEVELEIARKMAAERDKIREDVAKKIDEERHLKDLEKDKHLSDLKKQVDDLKRQLEQGSQQTQGEAVELQLEEMLSSAFPHDQIEPVPKGIRGADVLQKVNTPTGQYCGTIVWESKNTRNWSDSWPAKLKDDQRVIKAEIAVLATAVLPKGLSHIGQVDGVWVTDFTCAIGLANALRNNLIHVAMTRLAGVGKNEKMEMLYHYLSGAEFKQRVEAMVESFVAMRDDLEQERRATEKNWAKREKQLQKVAVSVAGMYGDMQGIVGTTLPRIERLELPSPESASE